MQSLWNTICANFIVDACSASALPLRFSHPHDQPTERMVVSFGRLQFVFPYTPTRNATKQQQQKTLKYVNVCDTKRIRFGSRFFFSIHHRLTALFLALCCVWVCFFFIVCTLSRWKCPLCIRIVKTTVAADTHQPHIKNSCRTHVWHSQRLRRTLRLRINSSANNFFFTSHRCFIIHACMTSCSN